MISFEPAPKDGRIGRRAGACASARRPAIFRLAESLGGVESLCEVPAVMTHGSVARARRSRCRRSLVRLSVGIEHPDDLVADVRQALDRA